jgi:DNA polymerase III delta prime subunit
MMGVVKKVAENQPVQAVSMPQKRTLSLPKAMSVPTQNIGDDTWLIYGPKKIGKTSLAAQFPKSLFCMFEPGAKSLSIYQVACPRWEDFREYVRLLKNDPARGGFRTIVIDTGFEAYQRCMECVCKENGLSYPSEGQDRGITWSKVSTEFRKQQIEILSLGVGLIVLCHDKINEAQTLAGQKFDHIAPRLSGQADDYYRASIDNVCYYHYRGKDRFLQIRGSDYCFAGVATQTGFKTPSGDDVYAIPMGRNAATGYQNLISAFGNKQAKSYQDETEKFEEDAIDLSIRRRIAKANKK